MNYQQIYNQLVNNAKNRKVLEYTELHHIKPKCMGGDNHNNNLVRLTAREHFIAHHLLYKIYKTPQLAHAWFSMLRVGKGQCRFFTSVQYERAKLAHAKELSIKMKGANNHFFGRRHTQETKKRISDLTRGRVKTEKTILTWIEKVAKKPASEKQKLAASKASKNKITLKNVETGKCIKVDKLDAMAYDSEKWKNPSAISQSRSTCVFCGLTTVNGNIRRWHNENCKHNPGRKKESL
jgi:hypothetical protein